MQVSSSNHSFLLALGERIRSARKSIQLTQKELSEKSGLDRSYLGGIERGQRNVSFVTLCRVAEALECDVGILTKGIPEV